MKNNILAMLAAPAAIPPNPKTPAINANIIKVTVQRNIFVYFKVNKWVDTLSTSFIQRCLLTVVWVAVIRLNVNPFKKCNKILLRVLCHIQDYRSQKKRADRTALFYYTI